MTASVVSAAILEGNLIIGLSDGSVINCGYVQGPQGLKGDAGPMGADGDAGRDGNTIITVAGTPRNDAGKDGDYAIDNVNWRIYGPKAGGVWGKAKSMLPGPENLITNGRDPGTGSGGGSMGGDGGSSDGPGGPVYTNQVVASGTGRLVSNGKDKGVVYPGSSNGIIDPSPSLHSQANINAWVVSALEDFDTAVPVKKVDSLPAAGEYNGDMVYMSGALYIWVEGAWEPVGASESNTDALAALSLKVGRVEDTVDFTQNTVGKGQWAHRETDGKAYPDPGEFFTKEDKIDFGKIEEFTFNDAGLPGVTNPGTLQGTRIGDYLIVQVDNTNNFGYYVITGTTTENIDDQHLLRTFTVKPFRDARYKGETVFDSRCTVATTRPIYTIVQDDQPVVSERGVLWYRESDDHLFISNYGDGFTGNGPQWTDLTAGGGDGDYLPLTGGTVTGPLSVNELFDVKDDVVEYQKNRTSITQMGPREIINAGILDNLMRDPGQYGYLQGYLPLTGGTIDGATIIKRDEASAENNYVFSVESKFLPEGKNVAFRVTAAGAIKAGHDSSSPFLASSANDVVTKAYFDANKGEGGGGGAPDPRLPYRLGTDKAVRSVNPAAADPSIELVDGEDMYSNVYIRGTGGITTSSDANAVRIDGSGLLPLTGGTLNGNLEMSGGYIKCLNGQPVSWFDQSGNWAAEFKGKGDKTFQMVSAQGVSIEWTGRSNSDVSIPGIKFDPRLMQWEFCNVKEPQANSDVASKSYVDKQVVAAGQTWAPSKFKYISDGTTQNINPGEFYISDKGEGERNIVLHHSAADGVDWTFREPGVDWEQTFSAPCCVRKIDGTIVFQADTVSMTCYGLPNDRKHVTIKTLNSRKLDLTNGEEYVIHIPGILPRFILS